MAAKSAASKPASLAAIRKTFREEGQEKIAVHSARFFKTSKGGYGYGDKFLGIRVPVIRRYAMQLSDIPLTAILKLLASPWHEERLLAVIALTVQYKQADKAGQSAIYSAYLANTNYINNWDIVDSSAHLIVGPYLEDRNRKPLVTLAKSKSLWERRIAMMACLHFIRALEFDTPLEIAKLLLDDQEDLIHKMVGWMLREVGNRDRDTELVFLDRHYHTMPRTMLRYAIEKFPETLRQSYLKGTR